MSLLDKAKQIEVNNTTGVYEITDEDIELVIAYFNGEINTVQLRKVTNREGVQVYSYMVRCLRSAWQKRMIGKLSA